LPDSSNLGRETDLTEIPIRVPADPQIADIFSMIYLSPIRDDHVVSSGDESEPIAECIGPQ
jgi:hypothetical protein